MKNGWFTIKEVSDLFDNTRGAIRFYEEKGLIHPRRDEHDFRWYSVDDIFQLFYLRRYASMSFSLDETLHTFVKKAQLTLPEIQAQITKREQELDVQIERLMRQREELRKYQRVLRECQFPRTVIEDCPEYYVLSADAFAKMTAADLSALKALIAAMPLTSVHADLIEGPSGWHSVTSLGIIEANAGGRDSIASENAQAASLKSSGSLRVLRMGRDAGAADRKSAGVSGRGDRLRQDGALVCQHQSDSGPHPGGQDDRISQMLRSVSGLLKISLACTVPVYPKMVPETLGGNQR